MRLSDLSFGSRTMTDAVHSFRSAQGFMSDSRVRLIVGIGGIAVLLLLAFFVLPRLFGASEKPHRPPPPVLVAKVQQQNIVIREQTIGTIVANATVQLTPQIEGRLLSAEFQEGQLVKRGDILFRIDPRPFQAQLQQAQATLARDRAQFASAQNDKRRYSLLMAQGAASAQQRDQAVAAANALAATVKADEAMVALNQLNLDYAVIRSPIDGKTGPILVQPGNLVSSTSGTLVVITQIQPVKVSFALPQADLPKIQEQARAGKLSASVQMHGAPQTRRSATVDFTSNAVDPKTGTLELRATFANEDSVLVPGQLVDVSVALGQFAGVPVVPSKAVNIGPQGSYIYVVNRAGNAEMRTVTVLNDDGTHAALKGRIRPGEEVITDGQMLVMPGATVAIQHKDARAAQAR
jgi:multidrug efflux system membrane fusion protein